MKDKIKDTKEQTAINRRQQIKEEVLFNTLKNINSLKTVNTIEDWRENLSQFRPKIIEPSIDLAISKTAGLLEKVHKKKIKAIFDDIKNTWQLGWNVNFTKDLEELKKKWLDDVPLGTSEL